MTLRRTYILAATLVVVLGLAQVAIATYYNAGCSSGDVCFYSEDGLTGLLAATPTWDDNHHDDTYPASGTTTIADTVDSAKNRGTSGRDVLVYSLTEGYGSVQCVPFGGATKDLTDDVNSSHFWAYSGLC